MPRSTRVPLWAEQEPAAWWDALVAAVRGCLATTQVQRSRIIGLAIDAPCNLLLVDQDGRPLMNSLIWMDLRGTNQAAQLSATSDAVLDYCGGTVPAEWPLPKVLWLKQHEPALWKQATSLIEQMSWLTWRLTGVWAFPQNSAGAFWHYRVTPTRSVARWLARGTLASGRTRRFAQQNQRHRDSSGRSGRDTLCTGGSGPRFGKLHPRFVFAALMRMPEWSAWACSLLARWHSSTFTSTWETHSIGLARL